MAENPKNILGIFSPEEVSQMEAAQNAARIIPFIQDEPLNELSRHIRTQWEMMRDHRASTGIGSRGSIENRLLHALRTFHGQYDPAKLQQIKQFNGSDVYARVTAVKCRGATSLLRDVYLGPDRPWGVEPTPEPKLPDDLVGAIVELVQIETQSMQQAGQPVDQNMIKQRMDQLMDAAYLASLKKAREEAKQAETRIEDLLVEGNFYRAFAEFLVDLPLFPYACIKGPTVRITPGIEWQNGQVVPVDSAKLYWDRISPFDLYWTPGVSDIEDADVIEIVRYTRADLNALIGVAGYDEDTLRTVLREHGRGGLVDWLDSTESERSDYEDRENPNQNRSNLIHGAEFHGRVQGEVLLDYGFTEDEVPDPDRDYAIQAWLIGRWVIKAQMAPSPKKRHPYYITSFEKVPGTPVGNGLPEILHDVQDIMNATARALVNNLSIASGPQVVVMDDRTADGQDSDSLYPWKRWHMMSDPVSGGGSRSDQPVYFFQPDSNASELLGVFEKFSQFADEISAIPRYITGSERLGGAGRTASGLAMLMGNASKVLQTVAANVDNDVMTPLLMSLYDMLMLTDSTGILRGDEKVRVRGVNVAVQRETERRRQIEFMQITANPIDAQVTGIEGRAVLLRSLAENLGMPGDQIVPSEAELRARMQAQQQQMMQQQMTQQGQRPPGNGNQMQLGKSPAAIDNIVPSGANAT